jgi:hypothetical protein
MWLAFAYQKMAGANHPTECPSKTRFDEICHALAPTTVRCLDPAVLERQWAACQDAFRWEEAEISSRLNRLLAACPLPASSGQTPDREEPTD